MTTTRQHEPVKLYGLVLDELAALEALYTDEGRRALHIAHRLDAELALDAATVPNAGHSLNELLLAAHRNARGRGLNAGMDPLSAYRNEALARVSHRRMRAVYQRTGSRLGGRGIQTFVIDDAPTED